MCGGIAASLIYDFLLYPQTRNFSSRIGILVHGPQEEYVEINGEENNSPGPSHWPKQWTMWNFSILFIFLLYFKKAISFILILQCVSSQSPVLCVVWTMTPLIKMLFSQVSVYSYSYSLVLDKFQTEVSASSFVICIHQNNAVYVYIPLASSVLPLQCIPICIHYLGFWQQSQNYLVAPVKQHKDVDQLIAHTSTLKFLAAWLDNMWP